MRVYVSSTKLDLEAERQIVMSWLVDNGHLPVHSYVANSDTVRESCLADIDTCDLYLLILSHRYGGRPRDGNPDNLSITHLEFRRAGDSRIPRIALLSTTIRDVALSSVYQEADFKALKAFRDEVSEKVRPALFANDASLLSALSTAIAAEAQKIVTRAAPVASVAWHWPVPWDFTAYLASKRGHFAGREWLFKEIEGWLAEPEAAQALVLRADFGVGKSAFVSELVHRDGERPPADRQVIGFHFCQHDTRETLRPSTFVRSLAAQLGDRLPAYRDRIESAPDLQKQLDRAADDPGSAFEAAILNPLVGLDRPASRFLIVMDALDESLELNAVDAQRGTLVQLLAAKISRFPAWLRLFVTSRNNPAVLDRLKGSFSPREIDAEDHLNQEDIELYIRRRSGTDPIAGLFREAGLSTDQAAKLLVAKSGGKFLYAIRALDDVAAGRLAAGELADLPPGMEGFYLEAFERRFTRTDRDYRLAARLLGVISVAREPLAPDALAAVLHEKARDLKTLRAEALSDFIRVRDGVWALDHLSLREWLTEEDADGNARAGSFAVDREASREALADWAVEAFERADAPCPDHVVRHLAGYLNDAGRTKRLVDLLYDLRWLTAKLQRQGARPLLADLMLAPADRGLAQLRTALEMCAHILAQDASQLPAQLLGRLRQGREPGLDGLLTSCRAWRGGNWLRPLTPTLPAPGRLVRVLAGHTDIVQTAIFSPDGECVLTGSADGTARLWRKDGEVVAVLEGLAGPVNDAIFSPDGELIVTTSEQRGARIWKRSGQLIADLPVPAPTIRAAFSPDGALILTTCRDRTARLWSTTGDDKGVLAGHERSVTHATFSPDGLLIATASNDGTARLWRCDGTDLAMLQGHSGPVSRAVFSPDGERIVTASGDGTCRLWDRRGTMTAVLDGHTGPVNHVTFSADGARMLTASNDNTARLWHASGEPIAVLEGHTGWVNHAAFSPDGETMLTVSCDDTARLWHANGQPRGVIRGHTGWVLQGCYSPDAALILTGSRDCTARMWRSDAEDLPALAGHADRVTDIALSPDSQQAVSTSLDRTARLWRTSGEPIAALLGHEDWITSGLYATDGGLIVTTSCDATARLWRASGDAVATLTGHAASVNHAAVSADGQWILTGSNDRTARLWTRDGKPGSVLDGHTDVVNYVAFSGDGGWMATASNDSTAQLWRMTGAAGPILAEHTGWVCQVRFSLKGDLLVTASSDATARVWRLDGTCAAVLTGHEDAVEHALFSADGSFVLTASRDGTARLWRRTGEIVAVLGGHSGSTRAAFVPGSDGVVTISEDGAIRLWRRAGDRVTAVSAIHVDAPIDGLACASDVLVCGDRLGAVHFLQMMMEKR